MNGVDPRVLKLLRDIDVSARRIVDRLQGVAREEFIDSGSLDIQDVIARRLGIIGEAASVLCKKHPDFCEAHPRIPLRQARGMRNILVHDYGAVDWAVVWNTAEQAVPELLDAIAPFFKEKTDGK